MTRLQNIENALKEINGAVFQNLCDSYLALNNANYRAFSRSGSTVGTQKTRTGTPDSFFLLPNGKYIFVEHSTNISEGVGKLKEDIEKCLDEGKTGISVDQITEIILCINFRLKSSEVETLRELLQDTRIRLTIETLDSLAMRLHLQHANLVHEYLGLPFDTGQIVSIDQFVTNYQNAGSGIATPLDNTYIEREKEFGELSQALKSSNLVIVTGAPGVGKTRLCLEVIRKFLRDHGSFNAYCLDNKHAELLEDLYQYFDEEGNSVLFIDDANRLDRINQVTQFYRGRKQGSLKLVLTVRDYAYHSIGLLCGDLAFKTINVPKFTDEQIVQLIEAKPFEILNPDYQDPIKNIADGNPRLAVMAARLGKKAQNPIVYYDVADLFDSYYSTFAVDNELFANKLTIKSLGLIAFFYTLPLNDRETLEIILNEFNIPYHDFIDLIEQLDKLELVEINYEHVKVPEQNISMYYFYRAFVKESQLSFSVLLNGFFETHKARFTETVIYANNTFGQQEVMDKLTPDLKEYWKLINNDDEKAQKYLETFWFYLQDETLEYIQDMVEQLPEVQNPDYQVAYKSGDFNFNHEKTLDLLRNFFRYASMMPDALELAFEFVRKKPQHLPELLHHLYELVGFKHDDIYRVGIQRQKILFDYLIKGLEGKDSLLSAAFYALAPRFLSYRYDDISGGRNNTIRLSYVVLPVGSKPLEDFRARIWKTINDDFPNHEQQAVDVLRDYATPTPDAVKGILETELPLILEIIQTHLNPLNFEHCVYVDGQIRWWRGQGIWLAAFKNLKSTFTSDLFEAKKVLDWDRWKDKEEFEFDNYEEYDKKKEEQIREHFKLSNEEQVRTFIEYFVRLKDQLKGDYGGNKSLAIVVEETFAHNQSLGHLLFERIIKANDQIAFIPGILFQKILGSNSDYANELWELINAKEFKFRFDWQMAFFYDVPESVIDSSYPDKVVKAISEMQGSSNIRFDALEKYQRLDNKFYQQALKAVCEKNDEQDSFITFWRDVFEKSFDELGDDLNLLKRAYLQQAARQNFFDHQFIGLVNLLQKDLGFLKEYVMILYDESKYGFRDDRKLGAVWQVEGIGSAMHEVVELMIEKQLYFGIRDHSINIFFNRIEPEFEPVADQFIVDYLKQNYLAPDKVNVILDVVRKSRKGLFEKVLGLYLSLNQNVDDFKKIHWIGTGGTYAGEVIIGDINAAKWKNLLSSIEKLDLGLRGRRIKQYVKDQIDAELKSGDWERKQRFLKNS